MVRAQLEFTVNIFNETFVYHDIYLDLVIQRMRRQAPTFGVLACADSFRHIFKNTKNTKKEHQKIRTIGLCKLEATLASLKNNDSGDSICHQIQCKSVVKKTQNRSL